MRSTSLLLQLCIPVSLLTGCPAETGNDDTGNDDTGNDDAGNDDAGNDDAECECIGSTCGRSLCPEVSASCCGGSDGGEVDDPDALTCALTALRDRTPGVVRWSFVENGGYFTDDGYVSIREDGTAVRSNWGWQDISYVVSPTVLGMLPPFEHFDACLAESSSDARFDCLRGGLESYIRVCAEGWMSEGL